MNIDIINDYLKHTRSFSNIAHMAFKIALSSYTTKIKTSESDFEKEFDIIIAKITNNLIDYHTHFIDFREILTPFNIYYNLPYTKMSLYKDFIEDYGDNGLNYTDIYMTDNSLYRFVKKYNNNKDKLNILADMKDYLEKNYHDYFILHLIIDNYLANNIAVEAFKTNNICQNFSIEAKFIVIPKIQFYYYEQIFKKYEIAINKIICGNYIKSYFKNVSIDECEMGLKINLGYNSNDVLLLKKNVENKGFFEKFFDFFK